MGTTSKAIGALLPIILLAITIAWYFQYQENAAQRRFSLQMLQENCFPLDSRWIEAENDYDRIPSIWDCSKDISGDPKPNYQGPLPDIREND
jgi:hypothetical protein